jgi:predicted CoA-binding protein
MILRTRDERDALLQRSRTIAVVGASANPVRDSYAVFCALRADGRFVVTPVNPAIGEGIDGVRAFPSLAAYAADRGAPDIVDVFRRADQAPGVAREAVAAGAKAIWFQFGVVDEDAIRIADEAGLDVVVDRCLKADAASSAAAGSRTKKGIV